MRYEKLTIVVLWIALVGIGRAKESADWMQFRGPRGTGVSALHKTLPINLEPSRLVWKVETPPGHSSPIVVKRRIYLTGFEEDRLVILCYDLDTGHERWRREFQVDNFERTHPQHGPASCTPVSDGERVFFVFGSWGILAYDLDGELLWQERIEQHPNLFGTAVSPIYHENRLILLWGNENESLLEAVACVDGQKIWQRKQPGPASTWSTPTIMESLTGPQILIYEPFHLRAIDWNGADVWSLPGLADEPITVPQLGGGLIFATSYNLRTNSEAISLPTFSSLLEECDQSGDRQIDAQEARTNKSILSRPDADGQGDHPLRMFFRMLDEDHNGAISELEWPRIHTWVDSWEHANGLVAVKPGMDLEAASIVWEHPSGVPECPTPIVIGNTIYLIRNGGLVTGVNISDGQTSFQERLAGGGPYYASPVCGDKKLYVGSARGEVTILDVSSPLPKVIASHRMNEGIYATPAICDGGLILRTEHALWRYDEDHAAQ